eukprot:Gregarina_sp_Poly_1__8199@NODE_475_length_8096_cov_496_560966_g384_i0_p1_GENE_NODE_475_length_8096_cov_496_560966_g384_i0NODE_475_length_8096_cov_496_560966_g384_i0_p1_ORF_typecomplete_len845_score117_03_NODE_475_length_8096_cov_496_560966_g384_i050647598
MMDIQDTDFLIQDFTTVSPFEKLSRIIEKHIRSWGILRPSEYNNRLFVPIAEPYKHNILFKFDDLAVDLYFRLSATNLKTRKDCKFYAKASKYQRWFGLRSFNALEVLSEESISGNVVGSVRMDTANTLLNAMIAAMQALNCPNVPIFVCKDGGPRDEHVGFQFQSRSPLKTIEYHSVSVKNGNDLVLRLGAILEDPKVAFKPSVERLIPVISNDLHLAALYLYFIGYLRLKLDCDPICHMRWVHVIEDWPSTQQLLRQAPIGIANLKWNWAAAKLLPLRSLHIFLTWSFPFWSVSARGLRFLPVSANSNNPTISIRPLQALEGKIPLMSDTLQKLLESARKSEAIQLSQHSPHRPLAFWNSLFSDMHTPQISCSKSLSPGDAVLLSFIASLTNAENDLCKWMPLVQDIRLLCEAPYASEWNSPLVLEPNSFAALSVFPLGQALDVALHVMRQQHLRHQWPILFNSSEPTVEADEAFVSLYISPHPASSEYALVLSENWKSFSLMKDELGVSEYRLLFKKFFLGGCAFCLLEQRRHSIPTLNRFQNLWQRQSLSGLLDDFSFYRLEPPKEFDLDQKLVAQSLWNFITGSLIHDKSNINWRSFLFQDLTFELECALNIMEHMTQKELLENCLISATHLFTRTLCEVSTHCRGSPTIVMQALKSRVKGLTARMCAWDCSQPPLPEICKWVSLLTATNQEEDNLCRDDTGDKETVDVDLLFEGLRQAEENCLFSLSLLSKVPTITPSLVRDVIQSPETEEILVQPATDRAAMMSLIQSEGHRLTMPSSMDLLSTRVLNTIQLQTPREPCKTPLPFLKEFIMEEPDAHLYASWHDEEFRVAWKLSSSL